MQSRQTTTILFLLIIMLAIAGCSSRPDASQIANPASEYCTEQGGTLDIRQDAGGGQVGYCQFDDGTECEEWSYFRGDCRPGDFSNSTGIANPASEYCVAQGGDLQIREHDDGGQFGICVFDDGSECEEWAFLRGECLPGKNE
jgi:putative hemolysin